MRSPLQLLASHVLERDVVEWAVERRGSQPQPTYRAIASELRELTSGQLDVTAETVRLWCAEATVAAS